jgi:hypothetical protein
VLARNRRARQLIAEASAEHVDSTLLRTAERENDCASRGVRLAAAPRRPTQRVAAHLPDPMRLSLD